MKLFVILTAIVSFPVALLAAVAGATGPAGPAIPTTPEAAMELGGQAYAAINSGDYLVAVPPLLMLVVWLFNAIFKGMIPRRFLPACSVAAAVVAAVGFNLATMPADTVWWQAVGKALMLGLTVGPAASGLWSLVGKRLLPTKDPPQPYGDDPSPSAAEQSKR